MKFEIKHRYTGDVLFALECGSLKLCAEAAVKSNANLDGANLRGAKSIWQSHDIIAEILRREAGDDIEKRKLVGLILVSRDWCWKDFLQHADPLKPWAINVLREFGKDDETMPAKLRQEVQTCPTP